MKINAHVVIIEDSRHDALMASRVLHNLGVASLTLFTDVKIALRYLEDVSTRERQCPDLILLDLGFEVESGFEVLRFYKANPRLRKCKIVVWTATGESARELCSAFGVEAFVSKDHGEASLSLALSNSFAWSAASN